MDSPPRSRSRTLPRPESSLHLSTRLLPSCSLKGPFSCLVTLQVNFASFQTSYKWNQTVCILLQLASFILPYICESSMSCVAMIIFTVYHIPLYEYVTVYLSVLLLMGMLVFSLEASMNNVSMNISVPISDQHKPSFPSDVYRGIDLTSFEHVIFRFSRSAKLSLVDVSL